MSVNADVGQRADAPQVLLIGGTSDAREVARALGEAGFSVLVSTATEYGEELAVGHAAAVRSGALDAAGMATLAASCVAIVDASHPFARAASVAARDAARRVGVAYVRFEREGAGSPRGAVICDSAADAARTAVDAAGQGGTVLLTVGSRTLATYVAACREAGVRCVARVLPVPESLSACQSAGLSPADIIAMQGPTSADLDEALLRHVGATVLVTKDSGAAGGVPEKLQAAKAAGATAIVVARPADVAPDAASSAAEVVSRVREIAGSASPPAAPPPSAPAPGLVHIYTGSGKGKTTASVGLAARAVGAGLHVAFVQFVKGGAESSELSSLRRLGVEVTRPARRSSGLMRNTVTPEDRAAGEAALAATVRALAGAFDLVVLDEACVAASRGLVDADELAAAVRARAPHAEVVLTGRGAPDVLLDLADYVTEMSPVKHPFDQGVPARKGVEY